MKSQLFLFIILSTLILFSCDTPTMESEIERSQIKTNSIIQFFELDSISVGWQEKFYNCRSLDTIPMRYEEFSILNEQILSADKTQNNNGLIELPIDQNQVVSIKNKSNIKYEYIGNLQKINSYVLAQNSVTEGLDFSELFLINKIQKCRYYIVSIGDWRISDPIVSKDGKYLAYYFNEPYDETVSHIRVLSINYENSKQHYLKEFAFMNSENFAVREIRWVNNQEIAICAYHKQNGICYYRLPFK